MSEGDAQRRKRLVIIAVSTIFLVAMVVAAVTVTLKNKENGSKDNNSSGQVASSVKAVKNICAPTEYKKECEDTLTANANNSSDPRELIKVAFKSTVNMIRENAAKSDLLQELEKDPRAKLALDSCKQLMGMSIDEFTRSMDRLGRFDLNNINDILTSLKVWISGAITYQETCLDAFENTTSNAGEKMKEYLQTAMHMSSNGLAIVNELSKTIGQMNLPSKSGSRRLLNSEFPEWVDEGHSVVRKLLSTNKGSPVKPNVVVAQDGSGDVKTITEALKKVPANNKKSFIIHIKAGVYNEFVEVTKSMTHVVFVGEGANKTRITGSKNFIDGVNTYKTASVAVVGDYFAALGVGFENSAGAAKHQAVALRVGADKSIFYKCRMDGYQDTLYAHAMRQFYRDCVISGTIDFVFGDAVAVFQNCSFVVRKPLSNQQCIVTAQGRKESNQPSGIVIQGGRIMSDPEYYPVRFDNKAYLARPWKNFSRTVFMDTYIDDLIQPAGYMPWQSAEGLSGMDTCYYAEVNNRGPGSDRTNRVKWEGIQTNITSQGASTFLPSQFFHGDDWIRVTRIPYNPGKPGTA